MKAGKIIVIIIALVFIFSAFSLAVGLQIKNDKDNTSAEREENINVGREEALIDSTTSLDDSYCEPETSFDTFCLSDPADKFLSLSMETIGGGVSLYNIRRYINNNVINPPPLSSLSDPWWDTGWNYRKEITIDHTKVTGSFTNFPVLISLSGDSNLASFAQANGDDIVFTNQDGTVVLAHEIDYYNSGTLQAWVNVTSLSSTTDTVLYMYFGNATCPNQENPTGVWGSSFVMVQHMQETSGVHYDSTSNNICNTGF